ncbi:MAG: hypothetical protein QT05_C0020G0005 [archaeon GW2011_AR13]|nr:MAG: hypothetical protein QT05_C0020G0005 [archaeon GW2011_AR13]HIG94327.1 DUF4145 domain-containing protein [Nanoarchaeota archaeon]HIH62820.1 DUF4145 domain-containing protein [Nanoarchaeota archaeon]HIJ10042.1 DUF4145 domain-containing protein [Nanoarchaeota archaeon]
MYKFGGSPWYAADNLSSKSFICWNCNNQVASSKGYKTFDEQFLKRVYICPHCAAPNIYDVEGKTPISSLPGKEIKKLPENIQNVYDEVRKCMQTNSFTGAVMLMRKIIMNIAVHEGAEENKSFVYYVNYLCDNGIVHKKSKKKADSIRDLGNDANHEIENRTQEEAQNCLGFIELLLMANYEFADEEEAEE